MSRIIGIQHRVKRTASGEEHPTKLIILEEGTTAGKMTKLSLKTEDDELAFVREGLQDGDSIAMILGGSGNNLAYALSQKGLEIGVKVYRISPFVFQKEAGEDRSKDDDDYYLARIFQTDKELFYEVIPRDRAVIWLIECLRARIDAMKARIACEQRLRQHLIGLIFCSPEGFYPEGSIEKLFEERKTNDRIYQALCEEEELRDHELARACEAVEVYKKVLKPIVGMGPAIASRLIGAIIDIRRFESKAKLRAFCGVHVKNGRFPRKRSGEVANWHNDARQALYLLGDQFNRRPDSKWGIKLREKKVHLREKHPEVVVDGKKRYTDGHIHKMALWWVRGKFIEWLWGEWWKLEKRTILTLSQTD